MKDGRPALRYAKAILNLAKEKNVATEVNNDMKLILATIESSDDLQLLLKSPVTKAADKKNVLNAVFSEKVNPITTGLFNLLEENKRITMLTSITKKYGVIYDFDKNIQAAKVTTAVGLTPALEKKIQDKIVALTGYTATIENIINPDIIGGFILRVGDVQYDASISNQFNELRREFDNSHFIPQI